jgi:putative membrane protein
MGKTTLTAHDRNRIEDAIGAAEKTTRGEIVVVVARWCDDYLHVPILWAALASLALPLPLLLEGSLPAHTVYAGQLVLFVVASVVLSIWPVRMAVTPRSLKAKYGHKTAVEQFLARALHTTKDRTGLLIFASIEERYCEIIVDSAIADRIDASHWRRIIDQTVSLIRGGKLGEGLSSAVEECGGLLAKEFPPRRRDVNELPDRLVLLHMPEQR